MGGLDSSVHQRFSHARVGVVARWVQSVVCSNAKVLGTGSGDIKVSVADNFTVRCMCPNSARTGQRVGVVLDSEYINTPSFEKNQGGEAQAGMGLSSLPWTTTNAQSNKCHDTPHTPHIYSYLLLSQTIFTSTPAHHWKALCHRPSIGTPTFYVTHGQFCFAMPGHTAARTSPIPCTWCLILVPLSK